jgi:hypothetical protein
MLRNLLRVNKILEKTINNSSCLKRNSIALSSSVSFSNSSRSVSSTHAFSYSSGSSSGDNGSNSSFKHFTLNTLLVGFSILGLFSLSDRYVSENCGIVGVVSTSEDATGLILEGLQILRNRGYDSCGIATVSKDMDASDDEHEMTKYLINLEEEIPIATR